MPDDNTPNEQKCTIIAYSQNIADEQKPVVHAIARGVLLKEDIYAGVVEIANAHLPNAALITIDNPPIVSCHALDCLARVTRLSSFPPQQPKEPSSIPSPVVPGDLAKSGSNPFRNAIWVPPWMIDLVGAVCDDPAAASRYVIDMLGNGMAPYIDQKLPLREFTPRASKLGISPTQARIDLMADAMLKLMGLLQEPQAVTSISNSKPVRDADGTIKAISPDLLDIYALRQWIVVGTIRGTRDLMDGGAPVPGILISDAPTEGERPYLWWYSELASPEKRGAPTGPRGFPDEESFLLSVKVEIETVLKRKKSLTRDNVALAWLTSQGRTSRDGEYDNPGATLMRTAKAFKPDTYRKELKERAMRT